MDQLVQLNTEIQSVITAMEQLTISSDEQLQTAGEWLRRNKATQRIVEDHFEPERKRAHEAYQAVLAEKKRYLEHLVKAERVVKRKIADYNAEVRRQRQAQLEAERKRLEDELLKRAAEAQDESILEEEIIVPKAGAKPKVAGVAIAENWQYEIVDESKLPREYLVPNERKILMAVKALKAETQIPGVRVFDAGSVRVRGKT